MKSDKVEIKTIRLNVCGKPLDLTLQQAKELRDALNNVFGAPLVLSSPTVIEHWIDRPIYVNPTIWPQYPSWTPIVTCQSSGNVCLSMTAT